ncbi:thiamine phosphate synthase [Roseospirillum parvum]|uniref:Thiamine-phosphate pyrophosphorylase n=1 Tax=Roseospirillum parvum TaxID=83401 RepID=A0A1G8DTU8_9PROT|nr:thiamine phosphate synthase [Roseospirillum parvum]SDH61102.1 thiamine-phosphate pyrophosphorylase [Roseospirillum parvum]
MPAPSFLLAVTDSARSADPLPLAARLPAGTGLLLRHYDSPGRADLARALARVARRRRLVLLIAADWRLAARVGAQGVHLPEGLARHGRLAPLRLARRRHGWLLTVAAHGRRALARAQALGADAALLGPALPTASHPGQPALGPLRLARLVRHSRMPVLALGGIDARTARRLDAAPLIGLAAVGAARDLARAPRHRLPHRRVP